MKRIIVVGSLNADLVVRLQRFPAAGETVPGTDFKVHPGGKGGNQACAAAKLGARVFMVGRVGRDANGRLLRESLEEAGVDCAHLREDAAAPTGTAMIEIDASGQNRIVVVPGANGQVRSSDVDDAASLFDRDAIVLLQLEIPLPSSTRAASLARERGGCVIFDPAPAGAETKHLLPLVDFVTPNESELGTLAGGAPPASLEEARLQAHRLLDRGSQAVVAKLGARGALLLRKKCESFFPAPTVEVVDTTAAGDAWNGAFAAALAQGSSEDEAGRFATLAAALSVTRAGAQPSMPTRDELEAWRAALTKPREDP
jgi:ribokinase